MDELRGLCIVAMVIYHIGYTMEYIYNISFGEMILKYEAPIALVGPWIFIFIAGISSMLTKSNLNRGLKLAVIAFLISLITIIFVPSSAIYFGIIHFFAFAMIMFHFIKPLLDKINFYVGLISSLLLFTLTYTIPSGNISFFGNVIFELPLSLYTTNYLTFLGFVSSGFFSADYFPIFPYIFMFFAGTFVGRLAIQGKFPDFLYVQRVKPLSFLGKHSLGIYVAHQPVIVFIFWLITSIF